MEDEKPMQLLEETHSMLKDIYDSKTVVYDWLESRLPPNQDTAYAEVLQAVRDMGSATSTQIESDYDVENVSRTLTRLYQSYHLNRTKKGSGFEYQLTPLGVSFLELIEEQQTLQMNPEDEKPQAKVHPWDNTDVNKGEYYALRAVQESEPHSTSGEINEHYLELSGYEESDNDSIKVAARLTELYGGDDEQGYVGRPPNQPYVYWLTDKGKAVLND